MWVWMSTRGAIAAGGEGGEEGGVGVGSERRLSR